MAKSSGGTRLVASRKNKANATRTSSITRNDKLNLIYFNDEEIKWGQPHIDANRKVFKMGQKEYTYDISKGEIYTYMGHTKVRSNTDYAQVFKRFAEELRKQGKK